MFIKSISFSKILALALSTAFLCSTSVPTAQAQNNEDGPKYVADSYDPIQCRPPIKFRAATNSWDDKISTPNYIQVNRGGWTHVHCESTSRTLEDGDTFKIRGNKGFGGIGVGLCIETCQLETKCSVRFNYNCVGFYASSFAFMLAADENGIEYKITADNIEGSTQGFTYNKKGNCVQHNLSRQNMCIPLPEHFRGKPVRAIGQVWNNARATIVE